MPLLHRRHEADLDLRDRPEPGDGDRTGSTDRRDVPWRDDVSARNAGRAAGVGAPIAADERVSITEHGGWNGAVRFVALAAAAVAVVTAVIALLRVDWGIGLDATAVDVAGVGFTPWVAIITGALGLMALVAAATPGRVAKFVVGAILACVGLAIVAASDANRVDLDVERAHGWLALGVGAVLILSGLLLRSSTTARRHVRTERV